MQTTASTPQDKRLQIRDTRHGDFRDKVMEEYFESSMGMEKISESVALEAKPKLLKIGI